MLNSARISSKETILRSLIIFIGVFSLSPAFQYNSTKKIIQSNSNANSLPNQKTIIDSTYLLERLEATQYYQSSPEEQREEKAFEEEQIKLAKHWLTDSNPEQRISGVEQLSAYPTVEAENAMVSTLKKDSDDEVRATAADYLSYIEKPNVKTLNALLEAMRDKNEEVRNNALVTLETFISRETENPKILKQTLNKLKAQSGNNAIPEDTRQAIKDYLIDQFPND